MVRVHLFLYTLWIGAAAYVYPRLPERYPIHFGADGTPDSWVERSLVTWFMLPGIALLTWLFLYWTIRATRNAPHWWNVPEKKRFLALSEAARAPIIERLIGFIDWVAIGITLLFMGLHAGMYAAAFTETQKLPLSTLGLILVFVVFTMGGALVMNRRIRQEILAAHAEE